MREFPERLEGFGPLLDGRIHLRCPKCGRKQRNIKREADDPMRAVLVEIECPKCVRGDFGTVTYFDGNGDEAPFEEAMTPTTVNRGTVK